MEQLRVREEIAAPAGMVWEILSDSDRLAERWNAVESCELEGEGIGGVRTLRFVGGDELRERLEARDDAARWIRWEILDPTTIPVKDLHYEVRVPELDRERCAVEWTATFELAGAPAERAASMLRGICLGITHTVQEMVGGG